MSWGLWGLGRLAADTPGWEQRNAYDDDHSWDDGEPIPATGKWYHASPHDLPDGTVLQPGHSASRHQDWYDTEEGQSPEKRQQWVWMEPDLEGAEQWVPHDSVNGLGHVYEVTPSHDPLPWNGTGQHGHVAESATITRKVPPEEVEGGWSSHTAAINHDVAKDLMRLAMPPRRIPPMTFDSGTFNKQMRELVYSDQEIADGVPDRADIIRCQGGSCTNTAGESAVMMSFIHHDERGAPTGILHYFPEGSRRAKEKPGGIQVLVHPDHQGKGVGTKLLDEAMAKYGPGGSDLGWWSPIDLEEQQTTPSGYGLYEKHRRDHPTAAIDRDVAEDLMKLAAPVSQNSLDRLHGEFHDWWDENKDDLFVHYPNNNGQGPLGHWPNIESFMYSRYPAAYKGHEMGMEEAGHALDGHEPMPYQVGGNADLTPYETGPEAITKHGYDPAEVAASMLVLHSQSNPQRTDLAQHDIDRLTGIVQKRHQMQRNYDQRNARLDKIASDWTPPHSSSLPSVGHCGNNEWGEGLCGHLALAFKNMFPDMKIAAEYDSKYNTVNHAWAYGEDGRSHDFYGTHTSHPLSWRGSDVREDVDPEDLAADMGIDHNPEDDHQWENPEVAQAGHLINRHWLGDDDYEGDDGYYNPTLAEGRGHHTAAIDRDVAEDLMRLAMPNPLPQGTYFRYHPELMWGPGVTAHAPGGKQVGSLEWYDDDTSWSI